MSIMHALLLTSSVAAHCATGSWALNASDQAMFRLHIDMTPTGMVAVWERPAHFRTNGESFSKISGPVQRRPAKSVKFVNGELELSFDDKKPGSAPDIFRVHCVDADHLEVVYLDTGFEPFRFVRLHAPTPVLGPWNAGRDYVRLIERLTNAEMTAIFDADQADRHVADIDWSIIGVADEKRRIRTEELLNTGALHSGDDFYHAAFVFQHGRTSEDYLKAHLLAMIATARGKPDAVWIAPATLDRYLQSVGKPQVLGTQYNAPKDATATQEPYDRELVSDAMRKALHVPTLAEQEERRREYSAKVVAPAKP